MKFFHKTFLIISTLFLTLVLFGCSGIPVNQDYDVNADFSKIRILQWLPESQQSIPKASEYAKQNPLIAKRIENAIAANLSSKGMILAPGKADAYITYHMVIKKMLRSDPVSPTFGFGFWGHHTGVMFHTPQEIYEYEDGTLIIDIIDLDGNLLWRGSSNTYLVEQGTPAKTTELVNAVVGKVMAQYPPKLVPPVN
ncbi:DUF4136 domain-containing protein [Thiomicrorhabdus sp. ZW0627]|uniref:DUF4136 domain-containing protein n=1 Tax=Thiomicrorhabdus sp. ZW0627 TaxID=3039774 RepID=UPI0024369E16|nr:DUF4136 domain-containing protein [Thiomicrorhabdus sp. ZW0627]MDG6772759.1 DUF4136 domain-containing protein [Thiomicrorhabdus sp. ZW0627]